MTFPTERGEKRRNVEEKFLLPNITNKRGKGKEAERPPIQ